MRMKNDLHQLNRSVMNNIPINMVMLPDESVQLKQHFLH